MNNFSEKLTLYTKQEKNIAEKLTEKHRQNGWQIFEKAKNDMIYEKTKLKELIEYRMEQKVE